MKTNNNQNLRDHTCNCNINSNSNSNSNSCGCGCGHDHGHDHHNHHNDQNHNKETCPVCSGAHQTTPEEYLQRIEEVLAKIPRQNKKDRKDKLILLTAGTAAAAAEHNDTIMLQIAEVFLVLRLAEESGQTIAPEDAVRLFREISGKVGLALTAKYGLEGLTKVSFASTDQPGTATLVFINCYGIGKALTHYFKLQANGNELTVEEAKDIFKAAKTQAESLAKL